MSKGTRREQEATELLQKAGYATYRPATVRYGENDVFGLFDVLAMAPDMPMRAVQVKSNRAQGIHDWSKHTRMFRSHEFLTEYWVPEDSQGWRILQCLGKVGRYETVVDERDLGCDMGQGVLQYLDQETDS